MLLVERVLRIHLVIMASVRRNAIGSSEILVASTTLRMQGLITNRCRIRSLQSSSTSTSATEALRIRTTSHLVCLILIRCLIQLIESSLSLVLRVVLLIVRVLTIAAVNIVLRYLI
jgi:hypothetical protein